MKFYLYFWIIINSKHLEYALLRLAVWLCYACGSWINTPSSSTKTDKLQVYPSPVDGRGDRKISVIPPQDFQEGHLMIYHTSGKAIYQDATFSAMQKSNSLILPSNSPSGLYYIVLREKNNTSIHTTPLIIQ